jgi:predicted RNA binding protein YcfA (HicA-like mRNA interferase family)
MGKHDKVYKRVVSGTSAAGISFHDLCAMLRDRGFSMRCNRGSHHIFSLSNTPGIINLQPGTKGKAKPYQAQEVRKFLLRNNIE